MKLTGQQPLASGRVCLFSFYWEMWSEEVKKNPFVVFGLHVFSGVGPRAVFVLCAENEKRGGRNESNNSPKVRTNFQLTLWIISQIRYIGRREKSRSHRHLWDRVVKIII